MWGKGHHFLHIFLILRTSLKTSHYLPKYSVFFLNLDIPKQEYFFFFFLRVCSYPEYCYIPTSLLNSIFIAVFKRSNFSMPPVHISNLLYCVLPSISNPASNYF